MPDIPSPMSHTQSWGDLTQYTSLPLQGHTSAGLDDFAALLSDFTLPNDVPEDPQLDGLYSMAAYGYTKPFHIEDAMPSFETLSPVDSVQDTSTINPVDLSTHSRKHSVAPVKAQTWPGSPSGTLHSPPKDNVHEQGRRWPGQAKFQLDSVFRAPTTPTIKPSRRRSSPLQDSFEKEVARQHGRVQRARNAANKRHSMSKASRPTNKANPRAIDGQGGEDEEDPKLLFIRERNRTAAAKCRAKSKKDLAELKARYEHESARHNQLESSLLELRNMLTTLRDCSLLHSSMSCSCDSLHQYNSSQARKVVKGIESPRIS